MYHPNYPAPVRPYTIAQLADIMNWSLSNMAHWLQTHVEKIGLPLKKNKDGEPVYTPQQVKIIFDSIFY